MADDTTQNDLILNIGGQKRSGWTEISVSAGIETCPRSFTVAMTELFPDEANTLVVRPGDSCTVMIGSDVVITGYVDRFIPRISADGHEIRIIGRGKCQDLVDCSAEWPGGQIVGTSLQGVAQKLCDPYGISIKALSGAGPGIPQFNLSIGETPYEIIERIARYSAMLAYEDADGSLVLSQAGKTRHASGFTQGDNVQDQSVVYAMDQRFQTYECFLQSVDVLNDLGSGGNLKAVASDPNVPRNRKRFIICEAGGGGAALAKPRVMWDAARRAGRATIVNIVTDNWRDSGGKLWTPNQIAHVDLPGCKLSATDLVIAEVTFKRGPSTGTTAELVLMYPNGFLPEPVLLVPVFSDVPSLGGSQ